MSAAAIGALTLALLGPPPEWEAQREDGARTWGVGMHPNIVAASLKAVTCAVNRALAA